MAGIHDGNGDEPASKRQKIQLPLLPGRQHEELPKSTRRKAAEACQICREKRIRCSGEWPCENCSRKGYECSLRLTTQNDRTPLTNVINQILTRLSRVEEITHRQFEISGVNEGRETKRTLGSSDVAGVSSRVIKDGHKITSATKANPQTGCFEFYGETSSFVIAKSLARRLQSFESTVDSSHRNQDDGPVLLEDWSDENDTLSLHNMLDSYDLVMPHNLAIRKYRTLQKDVADLHLENFFATIHVYFPIFDVPKFRAKYSRLRDLFGSNLLFASPRENQVQQQSLCLLYSVLALGALYAEGDVSSSWASWYFSEAQELLGRLFDAVSLELVQAGMFMGAYAQHALKPNLAYNLAGTATRMAFSIGLNVDSNLISHDWDGEEGRRTWWMIFIQEVELSVDCGRPMAISNSDIAVELPEDYSVVGKTFGFGQPHQPMADFIKTLVGIAQITRAILKMVSRLGSTSGTTRSFNNEFLSFNNRLKQWRQSLPVLLYFEDEDFRRDADDAHSWNSRHRSSLLVHYNLARIILHRVSFTKSDPAAPSDEVSKSRSTCLQAARAIILHVHGLFKATPCLRQWRYYCYYCLQAALVLLMNLITEPAGEETMEIVTVCQLSVSVFEQIDLRAARRCGKIVTQIIERWKMRHAVREAGSEDVRSKRDVLAGSTSLDIMPESFGLDIPLNDDIWTYLSDSEMHPRSFENWVDILNAEDLESV